MSAGTLLGPYEILGVAGSGGMGEVYRARDTRLDRTVAIKIISGDLVSSPELKVRFEREARAVAALNHSHICHLYDIGNNNGTDFLVMEYLEGESLAERLRKGSLPLVETFRIGVEIADALEKAHRAGIVHRDLKPGNVMLTKAGAKLLDFGLAKMGITARAAGVPSESVFTTAPTQSSPTSPLSTAGTLLGTVQYMAPEQIAGGEVDARSDIFALGLLLYEMATGRRAFEGKTQASVAGAILAVDPPAVSSLQPTLPAAFDHVVRLCLAKDPEERFQSVHDVKLQLQLLADSDPADTLTAGAFAGRRALVALILTAIAALSLLAAAGIWLRALRREVANRSQSVRSSLVPEEAFTYPMLAEIALSPDGRRLAFIGISPKGERGLWVRRLDAASSLLLSDTENAAYPFWSPDSRYIGFFADGKLKKIDADGGPPQDIAEAPNGRGGTWGSDGIIVFAPVTGGGLFRISAGGGTPTEVAKLDRPKFNSLRFPQFLPDGKHFLFLARGVLDTVKVGSVDGMEPESLLAGNNASYAAGYLLVVRQNTLLAQRFDVDRLRMRDAPVSLAGGVAYDVLNHRGCFTVAVDGRLIYQTGSGEAKVALQIRDRTGKELASLPASVRGEIPIQARFSPDGQRIAAHTFDSSSGAHEIWIFDPAHNLRTRFTLDSEHHWNPVWSPNGSQIAFSTLQNGELNLYVKKADMSEPEQPLLLSSMDKGPDDWSPDGKFLLYSSASSGHFGGVAFIGAELWALPMTGDRKPWLFLSGSGALIGNARFSSDGRLVAYQSNNTGTMQVYITTFPDHRGVWQVSTDGGVEPSWGAGDNELFFIHREKVYVAEISKDKVAPHPGSPKELFSASGIAIVSGRFDVSRNGKRFLLISNVESGTSHPLTLVTNWTSLLTKKGDEP